MAERMLQPHAGGDPQRWDHEIRQTEERESKLWEVIRRVAQKGTTVRDTHDAQEEKNLHTWLSDRLKGYVPDDLPRYVAHWIDEDDKKKKEDPEYFAREEAWLKEEGNTHDPHYEDRLTAFLFFVEHAALADKWMQDRKKIIHATSGITKENKERARADLARLRAELHRVKEERDAPHEGEEQQTSAKENLSEERGNVFLRSWEAKKQEYSMTLPDAGVEGWRGAKKYLLLLEDFLQRELEVSVERMAGKNDRTVMQYINFIQRDVLQGFQQFASVRGEGEHHEERRDHIRGTIREKYEHFRQLLESTATIDASTRNAFLAVLRAIVFEAVRDDLTKPAEYMIDPLVVQIERHPEHRENIERLQNLLENFSTGRSVFKKNADRAMGEREQYMEKVRKTILEELPDVEDLKRQEAIEARREKVLALVKDSIWRPFVEFNRAGGWKKHRREKTLRKKSAA